MTSTATTTTTKRFFSGEDAAVSAVSAGGGVCWVADAFAAPAAASLTSHFAGGGVASDATRPERLFLCAGKIVATLAPALSRAMGPYLEANDDDEAREGGGRGRGRGRRFG